MTETATYGKTLATSMAADIEELLREREMRYTRTLIELDEIDADASTRNQARLLPVHQETVEIYRAAMDAGDRFPPIVVDGTKRPYVVLDGNHRLFAAKLAGFASMEAFIVTHATKPQMELFTYEANAKHGLPTSIAERVRQGIYLVSLGNTASTVAKALSIPERRLWEAMQAARAERRLTKMGFLDLSKLSQNTKRRLSSIQSDVVLAPLADIVVKAELGSDDINEAVTKINTLTSEADQLAYVGTLREKFQPVMETTAGGALELPRDVVRLRMAARLLRNVDEENLSDAIERTAPEFRKVVAREVIESVSALLTASGLLKKHAENGS